MKQRDGMDYIKQCNHLYNQAVALVQRIHPLHDPLWDAYVAHPQDPSTSAALNRYGRIRNKALSRLVRRRTEYNRAMGLPNPTWQ